MGYFFETETVVHCIINEFVQYVAVRNTTLQHVMETLNEGEPTARGQFLPSYES